MARAGLFESYKNNIEEKVLKEFNPFKTLKGKFDRAQQKKAAASKGKDSRNDIQKSVAALIKDGSLSLEFSLKDIFSLNEKAIPKVKQTKVTPPKEKPADSELEKGAEEETMEDDAAEEIEEAKKPSNVELVKKFMSLTSKGLGFYQPRAFFLLNTENNTICYKFQKDTGKVAFCVYSVDPDEIDVTEYFDTLADGAPEQGDYKQNIYWKKNIVKNVWVWIPKNQKGLETLRKGLKECKDNGIIAKAKNQEKVDVSNIQIKKYFPCLPEKVKESFEKEKALYEFEGNKIVESANGSVSVDVYAVVKLFENGYKELSKLTYDISNEKGKPLSEEFIRNSLKKSLMESSLKDGFKLIWQKETENKKRPIKEAFVEGPGFSDNAHKVHRMKIKRILDKGSLDYDKHSQTLAYDVPIVSGKDVGWSGVEDAKAFFADSGLKVGFATVDGLHYYGFLQLEDEEAEAYLNQYAESKDENDDDWSDLKADILVCWY